MSGFVIPFIYAPLSGQRIVVVKEKLAILRSLDLADKGSGDSEIDVLMCANFYWRVLDGEIIHCGCEGLIAFKSKLGWLLTGPFDSSKISDCSVKLVVTNSRVKNQNWMQWNKLHVD